MARTEAELHHAASRGDEGAIDELVARHLPGVEAFVRRNAGHAITRRESCADLVQSACRDVLVDLAEQSYRDEEHFKNWLYLAAVRKIHQRGRYWGREKRDARLDHSGSFVMGDAAGSPSGAVDSFERLERVEQALDALPDEQRRIFFLSRIAGLSYDEIAAEMEASTDSVRKAYSRALARFMLAWHDADE